MSDDSVPIQESDIKQIAYNFRHLLKDVKDGGKPSHVQTLNAITQALWGQNYEEARETLIQADETMRAIVSLTNPDAAPAPTTLLLHYGQETILVHKGEYMMGDFPGTDIEVPYDKLMAHGRNLAETEQSAIKEIQLPWILPEGFETDDIINLAKRLGYFDYETPLIDVITSPEYRGMVYEEGVYWNGLDDEPEELFDQEYAIQGYESWEQAVSDIIVMHAEFYNAQTFGSEGEFFWTLNEIGSAQPDPNEKGIWYIKTDMEDPKVAQVHVLRR